MPESPSETTLGYKESIHIWLSVGLYFSCLFLPGYYLGAIHTPQYGSEILLGGWLGIFDGHISWYANPLFFVALLKCRKPLTSSTLGFLALTLALLFLGYKELLINEGGHRASITGYGWGYFLWISSISIFSIGQLSIALFKNNETIPKYTSHLIQFAWLAFSAILFSYHYYFSDGSQHSVEKIRDLVFEKKCSLSGEHIYKGSSNLNGLYLTLRNDIRFEEYKSSRWSQIKSGLLGPKLLNSNKIKFYETDATGAKSTAFRILPPYKIFTHENDKGAEAGSLISNYAVTYKRIDDSSLGISDDERKISGKIKDGEIYIIDMRTQEVVAKTVFVINDYNNKFCGYTPSGHFSAEEFIIRFLDYSG